MKLPLACVLLLLCFLASPRTLAAQTTTAPSTQPESRWSGLVERLGSSDFPTRQAAQKELEQATWRDRESLRKLVQSVSDEEVKASLSDRLAAIDEQIATDPPPVSLELKDATLTQVAETLNHSLGISLKAWPESENFRRGITYTLSVRDRPFWEVFCSLSRQHGLTLQGFGAELQVQQTNPGFNEAVIAGPVAIFAQSINRQRNVDLQAPPQDRSQPERMTISATLAIDPRMHVIQYSQPVFSEILDENGNFLYHPGNLDDHMWDAGGRTTFSFSAPLAILDKKSTRIASARGQFRFSVQIAQQQAEIDAAEKKVGQTFEIAGRKITLKTLDIAGDSFHANFESPAQPVMVRLLGAAPAQSPDRGVHVTIVDAQGNQLLSTTITGNSGIGGSGGMHFVSPLKMTLSVPTKFKDFTIPFELKDLPLP